MNRLHDFVLRREVLVGVVSGIAGLLVPAIADQFRAIIQTPASIFLLISLLVVTSALLVGTYGYRNEQELKELTTKITAIEHNLQSLPDITDKIQELSRSIGIMVKYFPVGKGNTEEIYHYTSKLFEASQSYFFVLNYHLSRQVKGGIIYDESARLSEDRKKYYNKVSKSLQEKPVGFKYYRLIQIPSDKHISALSDPILFEHLQHLVDISVNRTEFTNVRRCPIYIEGTFIISDDKYMFWQVPAFDPDRQEYITEGFFAFEDPSGNVIKNFRRLFERYYAKGQLIGVSDLSQQITPSESV